jgi:F-type H+-transporting ATPase subunit epsilon
VPPRYRLEMVAPDRIAYAGDVTSLVAPGAEGYLGVLAHHAPMLVELTVGVIKVTPAEGEAFYLATGGGFLEVMPDRTVVLADSIERPAEIDVSRAEAARRRAEERLKERARLEVDVERAEAALRRALNRLDLASRHGRGG